MPEAVLDPDLLVDALSGAVDEIRSLVNGELGTRPHKVEIVTRRWSGTRAGEGTPVETSVEILPTPRVDVLGLRRELRPAGAEEEGDLVLSEISLSYTEAELAGIGDVRTEVAYRLTGAHGQGQAPRYYTPSAPPASRRGDAGGDGIDWMVKLRRVQDFGGGDG